MAQYAFQFSLELTNLIPVRDIALSGLLKALEYARDLRRSGSDIVVEADLAMIFGQVRINSEMEDVFKELVNKREFTPIISGSDLCLASGSGPTVVNAIRDKALLATIIQLSMLAYFCSRQSLAKMIVGAINQRFKAGIRGASPDPGTDGIANTLKACSSQCSAFEWHVVRNKALDHLKSCIPAYAFETDHLVKISASSILAFMDMLSIVQRFSEERRITVSNDSGCVIILLWAHYIAGLTVSVVTEAGHEAKFGSASTSHVLILSQIRTEQPASHGTPHYIFGPGDPVIRLHESNMSIVFECQPATNPRISTRIEERHSLSGYGNEYLRRVFNTRSIIPSDDPIYEEAKALVTASAIRCLPRLSRQARNNDSVAAGARSFTIEVWRVQDAARLLFESDGRDTLDMRKIEAYKDNPSLERLDGASVPSAFDRAAHKQGFQDKPFLVERFLLDPIKPLITTLLLMSCVQDIRSCSAVPLVLDPSQCVGHLLGLEREDISLKSDTVFHGIANLLMGSSLDTSNDAYDSARHDKKLISLYSDFGWSIFLDTFTNKDPCETRREILHLRKGTPMKESTNERRQRIRDGLEYAASLSPGTYPIYRGQKYIPRCAAAVTGRTEDWVTATDEFEFATYLTIKSSLEWTDGSGTPTENWEEYISARQMHSCLWNCTITPDCSCTRITSKHIPYTEDRAVKLGLSAATLMGWRCPILSREFPREKILIFLTRGCPQIRWTALLSHVAELCSEKCKREILLVSNECCEDCALIYASSLQGDWVMIL